MMLSAELEEFVARHQPHGTLTADSSALTPNGYRLTVFVVAVCSSSGGLHRMRPLRIS